MSDLLNRIAQEREERVQDLHLDLPIPTWDGYLVARFNIMERKRLEKFLKGRKGSQGVDNDASFLAQTLRELYLLDPEKEATGTRMEDADAYVRIEDEAGSPVKFDATLAKKLGQDEMVTAKDVVLYCFKFNELAVGAMAVKVMQWMQNTDKEVAESIVGES